MRLIILLIHVLLFAVLASCEFEPHGAYVNEIDPSAVTPDIGVAELDLPVDRDTVVLEYSRVWFRTKIKTSPDFCLL